MCAGETQSLLPELDPQTGAIVQAIGIVADAAGRPPAITALAVHEIATLPPACGIGSELALLLPPLIWLHGRRGRAQRDARRS